MTSLNPLISALILSLPLPSSAQSAATPAPGPLRIHPDNRRHFTDGTRRPDGALKAVYLTAAGNRSGRRWATPVG